MDWFKTERMRRKEKIANVTDPIKFLLDQELSRSKLNWGDPPNKKFEDTLENREFVIRFMNKLNKSHSDVFAQTDFNSTPWRLMDKSDILDFYNKGFYTLEDINELFKELGFSPYYYQRFENSPKVIWLLGNLKSPSKDSALECYNAGKALMNLGISNNATMIFIEESLVKDQKFSDAWSAKGELFNRAGASECAQRCKEYVQELRKREKERERGTI